jgi:cell wall-associated NlpC family hydrolase
MAGKVDMIGLSMLAAGSIFAYAGITGRSALGTLYTIVSGSSPGHLPGVNPIAGTANPNAIPVAPGNVTGGTSSGLAQWGLSQVGHKYVYGGAPNSGGWDCSSMVSEGITTVLHKPLPNTNPYTGATHGPTAADYKGWSGAVTIPRNQAGADDLACWDTHIGIIINNTQMVSALNERLGTQVTGIEQGGPQNESLTCRRLK